MAGLRISHPAVKDAVVVVREDTADDKRLVAYIVPRNATQPHLESVRQHLKSVLPEHMVPSAVVALPALPLTANGKLDRRALPAPTLDAFASTDYQAPQGEIESALAQIWQTLLRVEQVGRNDHFFELGGHSLLALRLLLRINQTFGTHLTIADVYQCAHLSALAARIGGAVATDDAIDLDQEAQLDTDIRSSTAALRVPATTFFLTGGTGFVGRFLLAQLLQETRATIHCLVRASSAHDALTRLKGALLKDNLWKEEFKHRIVVIPGDLRQPKFGLSDIAYEILAEHVDSVYHCATSMNHLEPYAMARATNVDSSKALLRFAIRRRPKTINYLSTLGVFGPSPSNAPRTVSENTPIDFEHHTASRGYEASKWVGEKLFLRASARGIPCNVFRLGLIWADTEQGRYDELQREYRLFKSCLLCGYGIENYQFEVPPTPVDYAARAIVFLATQHGGGNGIFHISSTQHNLPGVFESYNEIADEALELKPWLDWVAEIKRLHHEGRSLPVTPLIEFAFSLDQDPAEDYRQRIKPRHTDVDCSQTHRELELAGIVAPSVDREHFKLHVERLLSRDDSLRDALRHQLTQKDRRRRA